MSDIGDDDLSARLFGPAPDASLVLPGTGERARNRFRTIAQSDPRGSIEAAGAVPPMRLSPADRARADALVQALALFVRNTNITASEPAHAEPGMYSTPIDLSAVYTLPGAVGVYTTVLSYTAPSGRYARIEGYGVDVDGGFTYDGSILWRIQLNGANVPDLNDWGVHRGTIVQPRKTIIIVPQDQTVTFQVRRAVIAGAPNDVTMALTGWTWRLRRNDEGTKASVTAF